MSLATQDLQPMKILIPLRFSHLTLKLKPSFASVPSRRLRSYILNALRLYQMYHPMSNLVSSQSKCRHKTTCAGRLFQSGSMQSFNLLLNPTTEFLPPFLVSLFLPSYIYFGAPRSLGCSETLLLTSLNILIMSFA